jgi:hypothetical protein
MEHLGEEAPWLVGNTVSKHGENKIVRFFACVGGK